MSNGDPKSIHQIMAELQCGVCPVCERKYATEDGLMNHINKKHPDFFAKEKVSGSV